MSNQPAFSFDAMADALAERVDMNRSPVLERPIAPVSGNTPAARHASASGAMVASKYSGTRAQQIALWMLAKERLTITEAAVLLNTKEGNVCGPWSRLEHIGWITGTGEYFTWQSSGRSVHREYHRLTPDGRAAALELQRLKDGAR